MSQTPRIRERHTSRDRGQAMVEFALVLPIFILLLVGLFDVGRLVFINNSVSEAAREGARWGAVQNRSVDATGRDGIGQHVIGGLTGVPTPDVTVTCERNGASLSHCSSNDILVVTVSTPVQLATPLMDRLLGTPIVTSTSKVTVNQ
jgi:Flp pilus assembly protein TadG